MINTKKTTQDLLQEEMLRERAATLARSAERLAEALTRLREMEGEIAASIAFRPAGPRAEWGRHRVESMVGGGTEDDRRRRLREINGKIRAYNQQRDYAKTRYHYLIVTREALGMIHHQRLEEFYPIPPKRHCLPEG